MADQLLDRVSGLVAACTRRFSRATRRLLRHHHRRSSLDAVLVEGKKQTTTPAVPRGGGGEDDLWSRRILMGERCQPVNFAGAIHYDSFGRRLAHPPTPRSASSLSCNQQLSAGDRVTSSELNLQKLSEEIPS
jgi:hypothetical protein